MAASDVRTVLLRTLFDADFHHQMLASPETALADYNLTEQEKAILSKPTAELYRFINPAIDPARLTPDGGTPPPPPPPPTTVVVVIVVAIVAFVTAIAPQSSAQGTGNIEKYRSLVDAIRTAKGSVRYDLVKTLVNELTRGQ